MFASLLRVLSGKSFTDVVSWEGKAVTDVVSWEGKK